LIAGRIIALIVLVAALLAPVGFVVRRELDVDDVRMVGSDAVLTLSRHTETFAELRHAHPSALLWALIVPVALIGMIAEAIAYRRAIAGARAASFTASAIRAAPLIGVAAAAVLCTLRIDGGKLEPGLALGGLGAVCAITVLVSAAITEAAACKRGRRGAVFPAVDLPSAQARATG
jgi:hypothetical protein